MLPVVEVDQIVSLNDTSVMDTTTPARSKQPVPVPVTDQRRSQRTRTIKTPYDPSDVFVTSPQAKLNLTPQPQPTLKVGPPDASRILLSVDGLQGMLDRTAACRTCKKGSLLFTTENIGVASIPSLECQKCGVMDTASLDMTKFMDKKTSH